MVFFEVRKRAVTHKLVEDVPCDSGENVFARRLPAGNIPLKSNSPRMVSAKVINSGVFVVPTFWQSDKPFLKVQKGTTYLRRIEIPRNGRNIPPYEHWWCPEGFVWFVTKDHRQHIQKAIWGNGVSQGRRRCAEMCLVWSSRGAECSLRFQSAHDEEVRSVRTQTSSQVGRARVWSSSGPRRQPTYQRIET